MKERRKNLDEATLYEVNKQVQSAVAPMTRVVYELSQTIKDHSLKESDRITSIDDRLDKDLEIYANNGKESKRVADNLELLLKQHEEMYDFFRTLQGGKTTIKWIFGFLITIGGAVLLVKQLLR